MLFTLNNNNIEYNNKVIEISNKYPNPESVNTIGLF